MARASAFAVGAAAIVAGAAVGLTGGGAREPAPVTASVDAEAIRAELEGRLREVAAGLRARASTLADLPRLQAAVATDAATVQDLTQDELAFRPQPGETIEIGQVLRAGDRTTVTTLWRSGATAEVPSSAQPWSPPLDQPGLALHVVGPTLHLADVVEVIPRDRADELRGALKVSSRVDLAPVTARAQAAGVGAWIAVAGSSVTIHQAPTADGQLLSLPLGGELGKGASLQVRLPSVKAAPRGAGPRLWLGGGIALLGLVLAGVLGRSKGVAQPAPAPTTPASTAEAQPAPTATGLALEGGAAPAVRATRIGPPPTRGGSDLALAATALHRSDPAAPLAASLGPAAPGQGPRAVGRYRIERHLGAGGMADVYLARAQGEAGFERKVALKVLHPAMARQPLIVDHFLDEARLASGLAHPNIVQITDLGRAGDDYFIAMEYVEGSDLEKLLATARAGGRPVPLKVGLHIVRRILDGLEAAHTAVGSDGKPLELVHRDVKSANVFIAAQGAVKIGDFGIAKANQQARVARTEVGQVKGTAAYMAPEHRIGDEVDARADLYSAAAIAYEVLTGQEINLDLARIAHLGRQGWPHLGPIRSVRPEVPPELDAAVFRGLSYSRDDRFPSCAAFEEVLEEIATRHGLLASDKVVAAWMASEQAASGAAPPVNA